MYCHPFRVPLWRRQGELYTRFGASLPEDGSRTDCRTVDKVPPLQKNTDYADITFIYIFVHYMRLRF